MVDNFQWNETLVREAIRQISIKIVGASESGYDWIGKEIDQFKRSKTVDSKAYWEILTVRHPAEKEDHKYTGNDCDKKGCIIRSLLRLSDNTVWKVGDGFSYYEGDSPIIITGFEISPRNGKLIAKYQNGGMSILNLPNKKSKKQPLFTTQDGVEIFSGDEYFYITGNVISRRTAPSSGAVQWGLMKMFSTIGKAKEDVFLNEPLLSVNDVCAFTIMDDKTRNKLIELAKPKMDK